MKARTTRIIATALAATVALTATAWTSAGAEQRVRTKPNRPVIVEYPGKVAVTKQHRKAKARKYRNSRARYANDWRYRDHGHLQFRVVRSPRRVILRPAQADVFMIRGPRFVAVRPVPVWVHRPSIATRLTARLGRVIFAVSNHDYGPHYGCNFCDAHFSEYWNWEAHVTSCARWRSNVRVIAIPWDDGDLRYFRRQAMATHWGEEECWGRRNG
jgi:hypothetical protein